MTRIFALSLLWLAVSCVQGNAADLSASLSDKTAVPTSALSPWQIRVRAVYSVPQGGGSVAGVPFSGLDYSDSVVPEFDVTYYFSENIAVEAIFGTIPHKIYGTGALNGVEIGKVWLLPPTLTLQYHFTGLGAFKPYLGAGLNYTVFFNQSARDVSSLDVNDAWGLALQAGFDWMIDRHWGINVDIKKVFLETNFTVGAGPALLPGQAQLNPWLFGTGVTYRF